MKKLSKNLTSEWSLKKPPYLDKKDKRYSRYAKQLKTNGFCDPETWGLDSNISKFILPRLIRFKEVNNGYPPDLTVEKWNEILDQMIFAFHWNINYDGNFDNNEFENLSEEEEKLNWSKFETGMKFFAEYFRHLWW